MNIIHSRCPPPMLGKEADKEIFWGILGGFSLHSLAAGMIFLLIPLYLFSLGGLRLMIVWLVLTQLVDFWTMKYVAWQISRLGFKKSVLLGQILWAVALIFFGLAKTNLWFLALAGPIELLAEMNFWIPYHLLFLQTSSKKFGQEMGILRNGAQLVGIMGPVIGGILTASAGFAGAFGIGAVIMLLASLPILLLEPDNLKWEFHLKHYWEKIGNNWIRKDLLAFVGLGIEDAMYNFFWPVFLLMILRSSYLGLGVYKTAVLAVTLVTNWMVGKKADQGGVHRFMTGAIFVLCGMWVIRGLLHVPGQLLTLDMLDGWVGVLVWLPFAVYTYRRAALADRTLYVVEREAAIRFGKVAAGIMVGIMVVLGWGWSRMVWVGVAGLVLMNLLPKIGPKHFEVILEEKK